MKRIDRSILLLAAACATFAAATLSSLASAQPTPAPPPSKYKNLKVLPADISQDQLRATMKGFALSLGVRCSFCHVGVEGQPLSTFDFPSDANPNKDIARGMLRLTKRLNEQDLTAIDGLKDAKVTCFTCHRGAKQPLTEIPATPPPTG